MRITIEEYLKEYQQINGLPLIAYEPLVLLHGNNHEYELLGISIKTKTIQYQESSGQVKTVNFDQVKEIICEMN